VLRIGPTAPHFGGGSSFGGDAFSGDQRNPGHGDPVAFLHELGLRKHAAVTRPKARCNTCLQARTYLHSIKTTQLRCHRSAPKWGVTTKIKDVSANLSAQANRLVKGKTGPAFSEEGIHKVLGEILGEHGGLCHV
jgi:hypothetical protein